LTDQEALGGGAGGSGDGRRLCVPCEPAAGPGEGVVNIVFNEIVWSLRNLTTRWTWRPDFGSGGAESRRSSRIWSGALMFFAANERRERTSTRRSTGVSLRILCQEHAFWTCLLVTMLLSKMKDGPSEPAC